VHTRFDTLVRLDTSGAYSHTRLARGEYEASTLPLGICVAEIGVGNGLTFVNVNTPHDNERAKGRLNGSRIAARSYHDWTNLPHHGR
jgi:hypothetical protein